MRILRREEGEFEILAEVSSISKWKGDIGIEHIQVDKCQATEYVVAGIDSDDGIREKRYFKIDMLEELSSQKNNTLGSTAGGFFS